MASLSVGFHPDESQRDRQTEEADREVVDLLFFPTGGGKTEAYLGLAAFTLVLRRLRSPGIASAGLSVLMRYTLRLLTLDQLGRAAALICALGCVDHRFDTAHTGQHQTGALTDAGDLDWRTCGSWGKHRYFAESASRRCSSGFTSFPFLLL